MPVQSLLRGDTLATRWVILSRSPILLFRHHMGASITLGTLKGIRLCSVA
jgi:hypothetical protein